MESKYVKVGLCVILSAMLISCAAVPTAKNPFFKYSFYAADYAPKVDSFLVILDASSSMAEECKGQVKLNLAKGFLSAMNQSIPDIKLNGALRNFGPCPLLYSEQKNLVYGFAKYKTEDFDKALKKVKYANGYSPLATAIDAGKEDLKSVQGKIAVIIVSDGKDMGSAPVKAAESMKRQYGDRLCIYTVLVGVDPAGEKLLKQVAKKGKCGFSVRADSFTGKVDMGNFVEKVFLTRVLDSDGDGVSDAFDRCPNTPTGVKVDKKGCPLDSDGDGVYDYKDRCPDTPKGVKVDEKGCPLDSDGDGVYDYKDSCPGTPAGAKVDAAGCWVLKGVRFDTAKSDIKPRYFPILDEVVAVMKKNPNLKVEIQGHTDNRGTQKYNQKLSEDRARSVLQYLVKAGIARSRLAYAGYGFAKPVASNSTSPGRAHNRRVNLNPIR